MQGKCLGGERLNFGRIISASSDESKGDLVPGDNVARLRFHVARQDPWSDHARRIGCGVGEGRQRLADRSPSVLDVAEDSSDIGHVGQRKELERFEESRAGKFSYSQET